MHISVNDKVLLTIVENPLFDKSDKQHLIWLLSSYFVWTDDLVEMSKIQNMMEPLSVYFAEKYATKRRDKEFELEKCHHTLIKYFKSNFDLRGNENAVAVEDDENFQRLKSELNFLLELENLFSKLNWAVIRKDARLKVRQETLNRTGL